MNKIIIRFKFLLLFIAFTPFFNIYATTYLNIFRPANNQIFVIGPGATTSPVNFLYTKQADAVDYWCILITNTSYGNYTDHDGSEIEDWFYLPVGDYHFVLELWINQPGVGQVKMRTATVDFSVRFNTYPKNNFGAGTIKVDGEQTNSGSSAPKFPGQTLSVGAIDQYYSGYNYIWNNSGTNNSNWKKQPLGGSSNPISGASQRDYNYSVTTSDNSVSIIADMKKICNLTFNATPPSTITAQGMQYGSTASIQVVEQNPASASASTYSVNGINFTFKHWIDNTGQIISAPLNPTSHQTYTAVYTGWPIHTNRNLTSPSPVGLPITLTWTDHPNPAVTYYQVWQMMIHDGVQTANYIADVNRGVQTFTDLSFIKTSKDMGYKLAYDVRAVYPPDGTTTMPIILHI